MAIHSSFFAKMFGRDSIINEVSLTHDPYILYSAFYVGPNTPSNMASCHATYNL